MAQSTSKGSGQFVIIKDRLTPVDELPRSGGRVKKFACPFQGCDKLYTRPSRLDEHIRSHTGEKPFVCNECEASFKRESHLKAHQRTHLDESAKQYGCDECDKRFWTNQHLKKHVEVVHRGKTYDCDQCPAQFRKHHQLRTHVAEAHSPPGTLPFKCPEQGCDKSFSQKVHLQAHQRTHDPSRYACYHPDCADKPLQERQFPNWTALQKHGKQAHPPTCPFPECKGKAFSNRKNLRNHVAGHSKPKDEQRKKGRKRKHVDDTAEDDEGTTTPLEEDSSSFEHQSPMKRPTRAIVAASQDRFRCPYPAIFHNKNEEDSDSDEQEEACFQRFEQIDDILPHMAYSHGEPVNADTLKKWFELH